MRAKKKKRTGKKHGGPQVRVVDVAADVKEIQLSPWDSSRGTVVKGEGYPDFVSRRSFKEGDNVVVWAFKQRAFRNFGAIMSCAPRAPYYLKQTPPSPPFHSGFLSLQDKTVD